MSDLALQLNKILNNEELNFEDIVEFVSIVYSKASNKSLNPNITVKALQSQFASKIVNYCGVYAINHPQEFNIQVESLISPSGEIIKYYIRNI